ncbi:hypothetical protein ACH5RR_031802, partial [Cinchona calisaya]
ASTRQVTTVSIPSLELPISIKHIMIENILQSSRFQGDTITPARRLKGSTRAMGLAFT